ncbi:hypothetical protein SAMN05216268_1315 [Streptomyces yunnanensis]|uniref:Uncharacterized protein n=1 Tax=Streptomyces yunnanensis TaxID=156453 RepID=A0A9X8R016_9ACTN|nr:hypothetical protein SAMN05216268_1315 [Streptomyces yunnanensis]
MCAFAKKVMHRWFCSGAGLRGRLSARHRPGIVRQPGINAPESAYPI